MKFLILPREGSPTFAAHISFKVGSVEENKGYTGAAHMLEHMLFKGTTTIGTLDWEKEKPLLEKMNRLAAELDKAKAEGADETKIVELRGALKTIQEEHKKWIVSEGYSKLYQNQGGVGFNAGTSKDDTNYIIRLPSNKLELWAFIESERMRDSVFREFYSERDVVAEERRRSYENQPTGKLYERFLATAFIAHPYGQPIIGWASDIERLPLSEMENFYNTWYVPNNAVASLVGNVDMDELKALAEKYFAGLPSKPLPPRVMSHEPDQGGERRVSLTFDANPMVLIGFHKPTMPDNDDYVFDVISQLLAGGRTGRFNKELVINKKVAVSADTFTAPGSRYPNVFTIGGTPRPPHSTQDLEKAVWVELERLKTEPVEEKELHKVVNNMEADMIRDLVSDYSMARRLTYYQQIAGDWRYLTQYLDKIRAITPKDIQKAAEKYFTRDNMTVATLVQKKK
ncbi:MAG: insulinase family protein [Nitrospinota bacterium]|nr:insulinase family protein [Nitrospinota bacterium]